MQMTSKSHDMKQHRLLSLPAAHARELGTDANATRLAGRSKNCYKLINLGLKEMTKAKVAAT